MICMEHEHARAGMIVRIGINNFGASNIGGQIRNDNSMLQ